VAEAIKRVARGAEIKNVVLVELRCSRAEPRPAPDAQVVLSNDYKSRYEVNGTDLLAYVTFTQSSVPPLINLSATFELSYTLGQEHPSEDLSAFTRLNALFNAYPYWRELLSDVAHRMDVAIPPIPLLKV
jgi:hypothetical protein